MATDVKVKFTNIEINSKGLPFLEKIHPYKEIISIEHDVSDFLVFVHPSVEMCQDVT